MQVATEQSAKDFTGLRWTSGITRANGVDLAWEQAGPQSGEPLVLIMGLSWQLVHWPNSFCEALVNQGFRLIRFDNRDIGLSGEVNNGVRFDVVRDSVRTKLGLKCQANYTLHDMAEDTRALMDALDVQRAHVVGVSMGGMISQILAGRHAARVKSLTTIMSSTNHPWLPLPDLEVLRAMVAPLAKNANREQLVQRSMKMLQLLASPKYSDSLDEQRALAERAFDRSFRPSGMMRQTHAITVTGSVEKQTASITAPTQVIHGLSDRLLKPAGSKRIAKLARNARLELIDGMGHDLPRKLVPRLVSMIANNAARV